jgi:hypothetical protein
MQMVRHVAVRINLKSVDGANVQNLLVNDCHGFSGQEQAISIERTEGQEIRIRAAVIKGREMTRIFGHDARTAIAGPAEAGPYVRKIPDGPAKAGPYVRGMCESARRRGNAFTLQSPAR